MRATSAPKVAAASVTASREKKAVSSGAVPAGATIIAAASARGMRVGTDRDKSNPAHTSSEKKARKVRVRSQQPQAADEKSERVSATVQSVPHTQGRKTGKDKEQGGVVSISLQRGKSATVAPSSKTSTSSSKMSSGKEAKQPSKSEKQHNKGHKTKEQKKSPQKQQASQRHPTEDEEQPEGDGQEEEETESKEQVSGRKQRREVDNQSNLEEILRCVSLTPYASAFLGFCGHFLSSAVFASTCVLV